MNQFGDLFKIEQDYIQTGDGWFGDEDNDFSNKTKSIILLIKKYQYVLKRKEITISTYYVMILVLMMMMKRKIIVN